MRDISEQHWPALRAYLQKAVDHMAFLQDKGVAQEEFAMAGALMEAAMAQIAKARV